MGIRTHRFFYIMILAIILSGCADSGEINQTSIDAASAENSETLATVNGESVTEEDVDQLIGKLSASATIPDQEKLRKNVLDSLITSRVIAQASFKEMNEDERRVLAQNVKAYREELLVKAYLRKHAHITPVSFDEIEAFYKKNAEMFGAGDVRRFEMLRGRKSASENERNAQLELMEQAARRKDWKVVAKESGGKLIYGEGTDHDKLLAEALRAAVHSVKAGQTPVTHLISGQPYLIRVIDVKKANPKPLREVTPAIRKMLLEKKLRKSIKQLSEEMKAEAKIEYKNAHGDKKLD